MCWERKQGEPEWAGEQGGAEEGGAEPHGREWNDEFHGAFCDGLSALAFLSENRWKQGLGPEKPAGEAWNVAHPG